jgi:hypothetical protein
VLDALNGVSARLWHGPGVFVLCDRMFLVPVYPACPLTSSSNGQREFVGRVSAPIVAMLLGGGLNSTGRQVGLASEPFGRCTASETRLLRW